MDNSTDVLDQGSTLTDLAPLRIWAARGMPGAKPTDRRAPRRAATGAMAKTNDPGTWLTRQRAQRVARAFTDQPGVGIMLGTDHAPEGMVRVGIDLDGCRDPKTGAVDAWAERIIHRFDTYAEPSPSGTGMHLLCYFRAEAVEAVRAKGFMREQFGRTFSRGDHIEIALFVGSKFLTVTGEPHDDALGPYDSLRVVSADQLEWLLADYGPKWLASAPAEVDTPSATGSGRDESGSGHAYRFARTHALACMSADEIHDVFDADAGEAGEWWGRADERERNRTIENARAEVEAKHRRLADLFPDLTDLPIKQSLIALLNARFALVQFGTGVMVAEFTPGGIEFRTVAAFNEMRGNRTVTVKGTDGKERIVSEPKWWLKHRQRLSYDGGVIFDPSGRERPGCLNLFQGFAVVPNPTADCAPILAYIRDVVAGGNRAHADYILTWLADMVQRPARKPGVALVLRGAKGVGKDTLAEIVRQIVGNRHTAHVTRSSRIGDRFNAAFATALFAHLEEASWGGDLAAKGTLQSLITAPTMPLERKGVDVVQVDSYLRLIFTANDEWVVPATAGERRYAVFEVPPVRQGDMAYWDSVYASIEGEGLAGFLAFLMAWIPPAKMDVRRPPQTAGLASQKLEGLRGFDRWWFDILSDGQMSVADGMGEGWPDKSYAVSKKRLRGSFDAFVQSERYQGGTMHAGQFTKALRRVCPEVTSERGRADGEREQRFILPPLAACRTAFAEILGISPPEMGWDDAE